MDILQCMEYGPEDFCPTGWYRHVFCRRGMDRADLTVSETSPQVEVEERRSRELVATARRRASARARTDGAVTTAPSRSARAGARATARAWRRASASASTAGMAPAALCQRLTRTPSISSAGLWCHGHGWSGAQCEAPLSPANCSSHGRCASPGESRMGGRRF